jgi:hypothetical protein
MIATIKLSRSERIRHAREADLSLTDEQLREKLGVTHRQIKADFAFKGKQATGHSRA